MYNETVGYDHTRIRNAIHKLLNESSLPGWEADVIAMWLEEVKHPQEEPWDGRLNNEQPA